MANPSFSLLDTDPATWGTPPEGKTYIGTNESGQIVTKTTDGTTTVLVTGAPSVNAVASSTGTVTVTPGAPFHTEQITLSGTARTVPILLGDGATVAGGGLTLVILNTSGEELILTTYYGATLLDTTYMTGDILSACFEFYFNSGWKKKLLTLPAY